MRALNRVWMFFSLWSLAQLFGTHLVFGSEAKRVLHLEGGFVEGTLVKTPDGSVPIETIKPGDTVVSCLVKEGGACANRQVETKFKYDAPNTVKLHLVENDGAAAEILHVSADHLFFAELDGHKDWVKAQNLTPEHRLVDSDQNALEIAKVELEAGKAAVYNLTVVGLENYYAGRRAALVHNFNPISWVAENFLSAGGALSEQAMHSTATKGMMAMSLASYILLQFVKAPYGKHVADGWGPMVPNKLAWILMELPSVVAFASIYSLGQYATGAAPCVMAAMWLSHYVYRTFIFPNMIRTDGKKMPLSIVLSSVAFNCLNSYINARWISHLTQYAPSWLLDPRFIFGAAIWGAGWITNMVHDRILINLRKPGDTGYYIPMGGLFKYVSCPNLLGEVLEWAGWAIATWSKPGLAFAIGTFGNLVPRAIASHAWYKQKFGDKYPKERAAIIPGVL